MSGPTEEQRQFLRELFAGDRCAECGELIEEGHDCIGDKARLIAAAFPELVSADEGEPHRAPVLSPATAQMKGEIAAAKRAAKKQLLAKRP